MLKIYFALLTCVLISFNCLAEKEELEERFKKYEWNPVVYGNKSEESIYSNNEAVTIYSPLIYRATAKIRPWPKKIVEALESPGKFFQKDADKAVKDFRRFAKDYRSCLEMKKWPDNLECLRMLEICFGTDRDRYVCNWDGHKMIGNCVDHAHDGSIGLKNCFKKRESAFRLFNMCFEDSSHIDLTFEIYDREAIRRKYYVLESYKYSQESDSNSTMCRFTVQDGQKYRLVGLANSSLGRPELVMVPLDLWLKDHYEDLLQSQIEEKNMKEKIRKSKKPSKK